MEMKVGSGLAYKFYFRDLVCKLNTVLISDCLMVFGWTTVTAHRFMLQRSVEVLGRNNTDRKLMQLYELHGDVAHFAIRLLILLGKNPVKSRRALAQQHCNFKQRNVFARKHLPALKQATLTSNNFV